jgi:hypothetical protein
VQSPRDKLVARKAKQNHNDDFPGGPYRRLPSFRGLSVCMGPDDFCSSSAPVGSSELDLMQPPDQLTSVRDATPRAACLALKPLGNRNGYPC